MEQSSCYGEPLQSLFSYGRGAQESGFQMLCDKQVIKCLCEACAGCSLTRGSLLTPPAPLPQRGFWAAHCKELCLVPMAGVEGQAGREKLASAPAGVAVLGPGQSLLRDPPLLPRASLQGGRGPKAARVAFCLAQPSFWARGQWEGRGDWEAGASPVPISPHWGALAQTEEGP